MKKRRILLGLALAAATVFSLSACDEKAPADPEPEVVVTPPAEGDGEEGEGDEGVTVETEVVKSGFAATADNTIVSFQTLFDTVRAKATVNTDIKLQDDEFVYGQFTFKKSVKFEQNCLNVQGDIDVTTTVDNAVLKISKPTGASGSGTAKLIIKDSTGATLKETEGLAKNVEGADIELTLPKAGTYTIGHSGSVRIYSLILEETKEKSEQTSISASVNENANFIVGSLTTDNAKTSIKNQITVKANYENGSVRDVLDSNFDIDITGVDLTKSGEYNVKVTSGTFETTAKVKLFAVEELAIEDYYITSNAAENLRKVYKKDSTIDKTNIIVSAVAKCGTDSISTVLSNDNVTFDYDFTTTGEKTVTLTYGSFTKTFKVNVVEDVIADDATEVNVTVDASATVSVTSSNITFKTISDAIDYLELCAPSTATKTITIADGTYEEKVLINIPNVKLVGTSKTGTIVTYDGVAGMKDAKGIVYNNGGSAVICTTTSATSFEMENLSVINKNNDDYDTYIARRATYGSGSNGTQAIALYNQADKSVVKNCVIKSCHDTLFTKNRQFYENCDIYGTTDYIFGENTTAYFKSCTIITVTSSTKENTAGYVGCNNTSTGYYGYIFDGCTFTHQGIVADGANSLGRTWKADSTAKDGSGNSYASMKQIIINSTIDSSYNTGDARYTEMQGFHTNPAWVLEFNNTGDGSISAASAEVGIIGSESEANALIAFDTIFNNGADSWTPGVSVVDNKIYYTFDGSDISSGTGTKFTEEIAKNTTGTIGTGEYALSVTANSGKLSYRASNKDTQFNATAEISVAVKAGTSITIVSYPGYHKYSINGIPATADSFTVYYEADTTAKIVATDTSYIYTIIINPEGDQASANASFDPASLVLTAPKDLTASANVLTWSAVDNATAYEIYLDDSTTAATTVTETTYTLALDGVHKVTVKAVADLYNSDNATASTYVLKTTETMLKAEDSITFGTNGNYKAYVANGLLTIDASGFRDQSSEAQISKDFSFNVLAGLEVRVIAYNNSQYVSYTITDGLTLTDTLTSDYLLNVRTDATNADGSVTVTISPQSNNNYLVGIEIIDPE